MIIQVDHALEVGSLVERIDQLRRVRNAVILAHSYQLPEVQDVADYVGDSLGLSQQAAATGAETIAFCGVHFMAETASVLCPDKRVLIPDLRAGCSLAASITGADVRLIKQRYPGVPVVTYVNTTAEVKAETDICCTSANAVQVVFFVTPIFWPIDAVGRWKPLLMLNPAFAAIDVVRGPLLGEATSPLSWPILFICTMVGAILGLGFFVRFRERIAYWI